MFSFLSQSPPWQTTCWQSTGLQREDGKLPRLNLLPTSASTQAQRFLYPSMFQNLSCLPPGATLCPRTVWGHEGLQRCGWEDQAVQTDAQHGQDEPDGLKSLPPRLWRARAGRVHQEAGGGRPGVGAPRHLLLPLHQAHHDRDGAHPWSGPCWRSKTLRPPLSCGTLLLHWIQASEPFGRSSVCSSLAWWLWVH